MLGLKILKLSSHAEKANQIFKQPRNEWMEGQAGSYDKSDWPRCSQLCLLELLEGHPGDNRYLANFNVPT